MSALHPTQVAALQSVARSAAGRRDQATNVISEVLEMSNIAERTWDQAVEAIRTHARVGLHFHPDRSTPDGRTVAESLLASGRYQSQFETKISNGSVSAFPGGRRYQWESRMFSGAYDSDETESLHRPKYGALDLMRYPDGPSPRFGSCWFRLRPAVSRRASFTYLDSHRDRPERGTLDELDDVLAAALTDAFVSNPVLGEKDITPGRWVEHLVSQLPLASGSDPTEPPGRNLDHYIEAQVHGDVALGEDVEALVADPSFRSTDTGRV